MASTYTTNKNIEKPGSGDYAGTWDVPVNADWNIIDKALGGSTSLNVTSQSGTIALTATQYQAQQLAISGTLTANVTYQIPTGVGGTWVVRNSSTGAFTITISSGGGGTSVAVSQGYQTLVSCDGTNTFLAVNTPSSTAAAGSNQQVQYNSSGSFAGSANLVFTGTRLGVNQGTPTQALDITGNANVSGQVIVGTSVKFPDTSTQAVSTSPAMISIVIDGGGSAITTGVKGDLLVPWNCTVTEWTLLGDQSGSIVLDIWQDTYANYPPTVADTITGSDKPTISASNKGQSTALTGWTTALVSGRTLRFNVDSVSTITRVTLALRVTRT
jgi:hypothetical protein